MINIASILPEIFISLSIMFLLLLGVFKKNSKNIIDSEIKISGKMETILFISYLPLQ